MKPRDPGRRETTAKVLKDRRSPRRRGRTGTSVWDAPALDSVRNTDADAPPLPPPTRYSGSSSSSSSSSPSRAFFFFFFPPSPPFHARRAVSATDPAARPRPSCANPTTRPICDDGTATSLRGGGGADGGAGEEEGFGGFGGGGGGGGDAAVDVDVDGSSASGSSLASPAAAAAPRVAPGGGRNGVAAGDDDDDDDDDDDVARAIASANLPVGPGALASSSSRRGRRVTPLDSSASDAARSSLPSSRDSGPRSAAPLRATPRMPRRIFAPGLGMTVRCDAREGARAAAEGADGRRVGRENNNLASGSRSRSLARASPRSAFGFLAGFLPFDRKSADRISSIEPPRFIAIGGRFTGTVWLGTRIRRGTSDAFASTHLRQRSLRLARGKKKKTRSPPDSDSLTDCDDGLFLRLRLQVRRRLLRLRGEVRRVRLLQVLVRLVQELVLARVRRVQQVSERTTTSFFARRRRDRNDARRAREEFEEPRERRDDVRIKRA